MDDMLLARLNILKDAGEIDQEILDAVEIFVQKVEKEFDIKLTEDNASMLITHIAMALPRIKNGKEIDSIGEIVLEELKASEGYIKIPDIVFLLENKLRIKIPETELGYIALHLCSIIAQKNKKEEKND